MGFSSQSGSPFFVLNIMDKRIINLTGKKFGKLTVLKIAGRDKNGCIYWLCKFNNGETVKVLGSNLRRGMTKGLYKYHHHIKGSVYTSEYRSWIMMKNRCLNKKINDYKNYGGRGIKVCKRWLNSFENFYKDVGKKPSKNHSIDRIDNDGNYCKENCKWSTKKEQQRNKRTNRMITYKGETRCLVEWSEKIGVEYNLLRYRLRRNNWDLEKVLIKKTPIKK